VVASRGDPTKRYAWASVTKVATAMALWVAFEEGTVGWEEPAGPPGATLSDLLSHASGLAPDDDRVVAPPRTRRIYSNRGIELAADRLAHNSGIPFADYLADGVLGPLGINQVVLEGSPAHGATGTLDDLIKVGGELLSPSLVSTGTASACVRTWVPGIAGVLPGFGHQSPNDWGLGVEIRDGKRPHWTGSNNSPATFGHFGRSGAFIWVDPDRGLALVALADRVFGSWAAEAWPALSDAVIEEFGGS
jgi:CubicO group peptidase (beta-lactamase class C family)